MRKDTRKERRSQANEEEEKRKAVEAWVPKTELGKKVKNGEIKSMDEIFDKGYKILEPQIVDALLPSMQEKLVDFIKTAKVRRAGRMFAFRASVLVGDGKSYIGIGTAKDKERWPGIRKATSRAKLALRRVRKGTGAWESSSDTGASVPFKVRGRSSSVTVELLPAPEGTGLVVGDKIKDVMRFVGIRDVWSKTYGNTRSTLDFIQAAIHALTQTASVKVNADVTKKIRREH
ncbi:MAG: 30S ribosomal protein S5 [Candidatus Diapherotrites archaeon]|nr:30S ribosomal protein S5 [Candidatus Diapherotrites archaeon]